MINKDKVKLRTGNAEGQKAGHMKMKINAIKKAGESWQDCKEVIIESAKQVNEMMLAGITHIHVVGAGDYTMGERSMMDWIECEG